MLVMSRGCHGLFSENPWAKARRSRNKQMKSVPCSALRVRSFSRGSPLSKPWVTDERSRWRDCWRGEVHRSGWISSRPSPIDRAASPIDDGVFIGKSSPFMAELFTLVNYSIIYPDRCFFPIGWLTNRGICLPLGTCQVNDDGIPNRPHNFCQKDIIGGVGWKVWKRFMVKPWCNGDIYQGDMNG